MTDAIKTHLLSLFQDRREPSLIRDRAVKMIIPIFGKKYNMKKKNNVPLRTGAVSFENGTVFCFFPRTILFLSQTCYNNVQCARKKGLLLFDWACLQASGKPNWLTGGNLYGAKRPKKPSPENDKFHIAGCGASHRSNGRDMLQLIQRGSPFPRGKDLTCRGSPASPDSRKTI